VFSSPSGTCEVEAPLQCLHDKLQPAVSSHAINLGGLKEGSIFGSILISKYFIYF